MGDMGEIFNAFKERKKEQHAKWFDKNIKLLEGRCFEISGNACLFREKNKPKVDFYPHTGRWKFGNNKVYNGGATKFLKWYDKQQAYKQ